MNKLFNKIATLSVGLAMAVGVGVAVGSGDKNFIKVHAATVEFTPSNCTNWSGSQASQTQTISGITLSSTGAANNTQLRLYASNTHTFSSTVGNITKVEFTCTASGTNNYGPGKMSLATGSAGSYSYSGTVGTWTGNATTLSLYGGQSRCTSIVVTYSASTTTCTVTYNGNKPSGASGTVTNVPTPVTNVSTSTPYTPSSTKALLTGYTCIGWNTDASATTALASVSLSGDTTLYAIWEGAYTVTYNGNKPSEAAGTVTNVPAAATKIAPGSFAPTSSYPSLDGYECIGWNTSSTATTALASVTISGNTTLYAIWEKITGYTITLSNSGVSGSSYDGGAERTSTINGVGFGNKSTMANSGNIQLEKSKGIFYNTSAFPNPIESITLTQTGTSRSFTLQAGSTSRLVNSTTGDYTITGGSTTGITAPSTDDEMTWTFGSNTNYTFFALKLTASNAAYVSSIVIQLKEPAPTVSISTATTSLVYDGSNNQTVAFTATVSNFDDDPEDIAYEWRTSNANVISVTNVGSESTANLKIVGTGSNVQITVYALGESDDEATSDPVALTVTAETYSGSLTISTSGDILTESTGTIDYTLTGNTHPMNTYQITSTDSDVISVSYNTSTGKFEYSAGNTPNATATVQIRLSSSIYSLEYYTANLSVRLIDAQSVASVTTNYNNRNVKFGGSTLSFVATVTLVGGGDPTGKQVTWTPVDSGVCTITPSADTLTGTVVPVNVGSTTVRVASVDDPTKYHDVTVNVAAPDVKTYSDLELTVGLNAKTTYYLSDTTVDTTDLSLNAIFTNIDYPTYRESVSVAVDASGVTWTLDLTNEEVVVVYEVSGVTHTDSFTINVTKAATFVSTEHTDFANGKVYVIGEFTFTVYKNDAGNDPTYNTTHGDCRLYAKSYMTIVGSSKVESIDTITIKYGYIEKDAQRNFDLDVDYTEDYDSVGDLSVVTIDETANSVSLSVPNVSGYQLRFDYINIEYTEVEAQDKDVESVEVTPSSVSIESGEEYRLSVEVLPVDARDTSVTWSVTSASPSGCVTVDENGVVHAVAVGTATVVATSNDQDTISDSCLVTVTQGPLYKYEATEAITGTQTKLNGEYFTITNNSGSTGYDAEKGAQFGSNNHNAGTVTLKTTDLAFATSGLRVVVIAAYSGEGSSPTISSSIGNTSLGSETLTKTADEYTFEFSGSGSSTVSLSNLLTISLNNGKGAVYIKSIKVYSAASQSVLGSFMTNQLRMNSYDPGGTQGSTGGNGSCKAWWSDVSSTYNNFTDEQKAVFASDDDYEAARERLSEWARINSYSYDSSNQTLTQVNSRISIATLFGANSGSTALIVIIVSVISAAAVGGYFFLRKKKED